MVNANEPSAASKTIFLNSRQAEYSEPSDEEIVIRDRNGTEFVGKATCGTFSSVAVVLDRRGLSCGDPVEADYGGVSIPATVRRAYERPDGKWIVTLRWGNPHHQSTACT
jgi:hypothetical protein